MFVRTTAGESGAFASAMTDQSTAFATAADGRSANPAASPLDLAG
jgi:hypothetical protein